MRLAGIHYRTGSPCTVVCDGQRIVAIEDGIHRPDHGGEDVMLSPGLIDVQHNGYDGHGFTDAECSVEDMKAVVEANWRTGTTHFYPTIYTQSDEVYRTSLIKLAQLAQDPRCGRAVLGIHVEGPYISGEDGPRGAHNLQYVRDPSFKEFQGWQEAAEGRISLITLAPEREGAIAFIQQVRASGVQVALGHHMAEAAVIDEAVRAGAGMVTHLGNGAHRMVHRFHNYIFEQLADDRLSVGVIADGEHLPDAVLRIFFRTKPHDKIILVSDVVKWGGKAPGRYGNDDGIRVRVLESGRVEVDDDSGNLAGAGRLLDRCLVKAAELGEFSLADAIDMAALNPARFFGVDDRLGSLAVGKEASLVMFDRAMQDTLQARVTVVAGDVVHVC